MTKNLFTVKKYTLNQQFKLNWEIWIKKKEEENKEPEEKNDEDIEID